MTYHRLAPRFERDSRGNHGPILGWYCKHCPERWPELPPVSERTGCVSTGTTDASPILASVVPFAAKAHERGDVDHTALPAGERAFGIPPSHARPSPPLPT